MHNMLVIKHALGLTNKVDVFSCCGYLHIAPLLHHIVNLQLFLDAATCYNEVESSLPHAIPKMR